MNKFLTKLFGVSLAIVMTIGVGAGLNLHKQARETRADDAVYYTLTPASGSNNAYASTCDVNIEAASTDMAYNPIDNPTITWNVGGNSTTNPWRIGGKSLSDVNRAVYSKTAMPSAITKVDLTVGAASSITVNSLKLIVASDASFSSQIDEVTVTFGASRTLSFEPSNPLTEWAENAYYKFLFNVSVSGTTNRFVEFSKAEFYAEDNGSQEIPTVTGVTKKTAPTKTAYYPGEEFEPAGFAATVAYSNGESVDVTYDGRPGDFSWSPEIITEAGTVEIQYKNYADMKVTQQVTLVTPMTVAQARSAIDLAPNSVVQNAYVQGKISRIDSYSSKYKSITYWISDDGTTQNQFEVYSGKGLNGAGFNAITDIERNAVVVVCGTIKLYQGEIYEFASNSSLKSYVDPVKTLVSISLSGNFKTEYMVNESVDPTGLIVTAKYDNDSTKDVTSQVTFSDPVMSEVRRQKVTVSYTEGGVTARATYRINIRSKMWEEYKFFEKEIVTESNYLIVYNNRAMKNEISSHRASYEDVNITMSYYKTNNDTIAWTLAEDGGYYTIYSPTIKKYLATTNASNQVALVDDGTDEKAKWTIYHNSEDNTYKFENLAKANAGSSDKWLKNNGIYGFSCYTAGNGDSLYLYKRDPVVEFEGQVTETSLNYQYTYDQGIYSYWKAGIRYAGSLRVQAWRDMDEVYHIKGYGFMVTKTSFLNTYGSTTTIESSYRNIRNNSASVEACIATVDGKQYVKVVNNSIRYFYTSVEDSDNHPYQMGNEYAWSLYKNIDDSLDGASHTALNTSYTAVPFIRTETADLLFMREMSITAGELAHRILVSGETFEDPEVEGSMRAMACLEVVA